MLAFATPPQTGALTPPFFPRMRALADYAVAQVAGTHWTTSDAVAGRDGRDTLVEVERRATAKALGEREDDFMRLKVEGLLEAGEVIVVALADGREKHVFGRRTLPEMDLASVACAIQNMWLAARAEGIGLGWVSIFDPAELATLLGMPVGARPVAILCIGHVEAFYPRPMLEIHQWAERMPLETVVFENGWRDETPAKG